MGKVQARNTIDTHGTDMDQGAGTPGIAVPPASLEQMLKTMGLANAHLMKMANDRAYDYSHPVDEYAPQGGTAVITNTVTVQPDYDMPERINGLTVIIPVGSTAAVLQLGQRLMQLYSGSALTVPGILCMNVMGIVLNSDDPRRLTLTGTLTPPPYVGLTGFALTRGQFS
jgi:hypothetical protein